MLEQRYAVQNKLLVGKLEVDNDCQTVHMYTSNA